MRLNESQSLFAKTVCLCQHILHASMRYADANGNRRSVCACIREWMDGSWVEWNATKLKVICMQSSVDFFLSLSLLFFLPYDTMMVTIWILSVRCAKIDFIQIWMCRNAPSPPLRIPSSTELYIFKFAHFDIQNTELITMTSRQMK